MADEFATLLKHIEDVIGCSVPDDVAARVKDEGFTARSFWLNTEPDFAELGFKMAARKLLVQFIRTRSKDVQQESIGSPRPSVSHDVSISSPAVNVVTTTSATVKEYPIEELLRNYAKQGKGAALADKLKSGVYYTREERILMFKVLGKYLMKNSEKADDPSDAERTAMAKAVVDTFPVLLNKDTPNGYEEIYCSNGCTGHLGRFIRQRRSRDPFINTRWTWKKNSAPAVDYTSFDDEERSLREMRPTGSNLAQLKDLMDRTRERRREWIRVESPDATTILKRYPRFLDVNELVDDEFSAVVGSFQPLRDGWAAVRDRVLEHCNTLSNSSVRSALDSIRDEFDEDKKTEVSLLLLPHLMVPPPKQRVKKARIGRDMAVKLLFVDMNEDQMGVPEALMEIQKNLGLPGTGQMQPLLFRLADVYYVKVDSQAIAIPSAACFCDALEFLFKCFYVFDVEFPYELKPVYGLLQRVAKVKVTIGKSTALSDFVGLLRL